MARLTTRSVSLPLESNPIMLRITKELKKLKAWEESSSSKAETLSIGLSGISDLYKCVGQFLSLPLTQQALSMHQHGKFVAELIEGSSRLLEICKATKDVTVQLKEASRNLSSFGDLHEKDLSISRYFCSRKKITKNAKNLMSSLQKMERDTFGSSKLVGDDNEHRLSAVINVLRCVTIISISILESLISFLGLPASKPSSSSKFSLFSKLMSHKGKPACGESSDELESVDLALRFLCYNGKADEDDVQVLTKRLDALDVGIDRIESGLDSLFSQLTETRASLLETFSF